MTVHGNIGDTIRNAVKLVQHAGHGGDSRLAHVNPREQRMLRASGGSGNVNPRTGLTAFQGGGRDGSNIVRRFRGADAPSVTGQFVVGSGPKTETTAGAPVRESRGGLVLAGTAPASTPTPAATLAPTPTAPLLSTAGVVAPLPATTPSPIGQAFVGAINRSSGNTGSAALRRTAVERARRAGTSEADLVFSVDRSRQRSKSGGVVKLDESGL